MVLSLKYGDLSSTVSESNKLANELGQYCDGLSKKVQQKMYSAEGGMSSALNSADYYVNAKIKQLRAKENNARSLSTKTQTLLDTAKRVDSDVEKTIQAEQKAFFKKNPDLKSSKVKLAIVSFFCDMKNVPVLGWIIKGGEQLFGALDTLKNNIRYWYKCEGGKELVGIVISVVGVVLAVVLLVCACVFTGGGILAVIVFVAGVVSAVIATVNAVTKVVTAAQAYGSATSGHPGMAKIYSDRKKLTDVLRETNFHDKRLNRQSMVAATVIEITDAVCSIIAIVNTSVKAIDKLKNVNVSKVFDAIGWSRSTLGTRLDGTSTFWNGLKSVVLKFNVKDFVLGDLNVKNLARLDLLDTKTKISAIKDFTKAVKGIVDGIEKINDGKQTFGNLFLQRIVIGLDKTFLRQQQLETIKGVRSFQDTNFTKIVNVVRIPLDGVGLAKLLTDFDKSKALSFITNTKDGGIQKIGDIIKSIGKVNSFNINLVDIPDMSSIRMPATNININVNVPTFVLPKLNFTFNLSAIRPYYAVNAA